MKKFLWIFASACALTCTNAHATTYKINDLSTLSGATSSYAYDINNSGQVVGWSDVVIGTSWIRPVIWNSHGNINTLGTLPGKTAGIAYAINNAGVSVGVLCQNSINESVAVIWDANGNARSIGTLPGDYYSTATAINNLGQVVGWSRGPGNYSRPFLWTADSGIQEINTLTGAAGGVATDINDNGQIVGYSIITHQYPGYLQQYYRAFKRSASSVVSDLPPVASYIGAASAINNSGQVVGYSQISTDRPQNHAVLWSTACVATDLDPTLYFASQSEASDINKWGQIVGNSLSRNSSLDHGMFWDKNGVMTDLGDLGQGQFGSKAEAINDSGLIVGWSDGDFSGSNGHATIWTPVPEPSSLAALTFGFLPLAGLVLRRRK